MAYDEGAAQILRDDLAGLADITEKKMFGGLGFFLAGNMVAGAHGAGGMFRVGKPREAQALAIEGARPMAFTGRRMGGMVEADADVLADDKRRGRLLALALENARSLPPK